MHIQLFASELSGSIVLLCLLSEEDSDESTSVLGKMFLQNWCWCDGTAAVVSPVCFSTVKEQFFLKQQDTGVTLRLCKDDVASF